MRNSLRLWLACCSLLLTAFGCTTSSDSTTTASNKSGVGNAQNDATKSSDSGKESNASNAPKTDGKENSTSTVNASASNAGASPSEPSPSVKPTTVASKAADSSGGVSALPSEPIAAVVESKPATENTKKAVVAKQNPEPATAAQTLALINLSELPRINEKTLLNQEPTYVYYSCNSSLAAVDAFYKAEFQARGWKESESIVTSNPDQYIDRNFTKNDFVIRFGASIGSTHGEVSVMLSNLGNIDVRLLPMMDDFEMAPNSPVNAGHKTSSSIPDVADKLGQKMLDSGWQRTVDFHGQETDVPHYRSLTYRKNAIRVILGISRDPQKPSEKTMVFYHAENVMPFDIPTVDSKAPLKLDAFSGHAAFETKLNREQMVEVLAKNAEKFDWTLRNAKEFTAKEAHGVYIVTGKKRAMMARLVESKGVMSIDFENIAYKEPSESPTTPTASSVAVDSSNSDPSNKPSASTQKSETDKSIEAFQSEINKTIDDELKKALGSINLGAAGATDLNALKAKAEALSKLSLDDDEEPTRKSKAAEVNPYDVAEDTKLPSDADQKISASQCTLKHGANSYSLKHVAGFVKMESGQKVKHIIFAEKPINVDKLKRMLQNNESVHAFDVRTESFTPILDVQISGDSVSINAVVGSNSIATNSSEIRSTVVYRDGKLVGRIFTDKPMELGKENLEFRAEVNLPVVRVDWQGTPDPSSRKLVADSTRDFPIPEGCNNFSSEGSKYLKTVNASIEAPQKAVEDFYASEFLNRGWKERPKTAGQKSRKFSDGKEEIELELSSSGQATNIQMIVRNGVAAKADNMIPPPGKGMALLGNLSDETIEVTIAGKVYTLKPQSGASNPKDATRVTVEPGACNIQFKSKSSGKVTTQTADIPAGTTWGVLYDAGFQDVMRFF